ncbi:MAG TPA: histidine phosphatase family protein [Kofleriaceae bacterium]|nr:histidine phosphatase family protein [Kofleriaceae bacterium]
MRCLLLLLASVIVGCGDDTSSAPDAKPDVVVYVVRHAETGSTATDPSLDGTGQARAQALATRLVGAHITAAFASQYKRTQETAMPAAAAEGLTVTAMPVTSANAATYGGELVTAVMTSNAHAALIVGHSNTVPDTVKAFTGVVVTPIAESEYDRFYTITVSSDGSHLDEARY